MAESYEMLYEDRHGNRIDGIFDAPLTVQPRFRNLPEDDRTDEHYEPRSLLGFRCLKSATKPVRFTVRTTLGTAEQTQTEARFLLPKDTRDHDVTTFVQRGA